MNGVERTERANDTRAAIMDATYRALLPTATPT